MAKPAKRPSSKSFRIFLRQLGPLLRPYWLRQLEVLFYMLIGAGYMLVLPLSSKYLVDHIIPERDLAGLGVFIGILLAVYLANALIQLRRAYVNNWVNQRILIDLQERMFNHLQRLSHNFYTEAKVGDIMARMSTDIQVVQQAMSQIVGVGVFMTLNLIVAIIAALVLNLVLGGIILLTIPAFALGYLLLRSRLEEASLKKSELNGKASATLQENLAAHSVIKAFNMEDRAIGAYHHRLTDLFKATLRLVVFGSLFETSVSLAATLSQLIVLGAGGYMVMQGQLTVGTLLAFIGLLPSFFAPVASLSNVGQSVQMASGSLTRINELLDQPVEIADKPGAYELAPLSQQIQFEDVSFSYDKDQKLIENLSLQSPAGSHVAIVGPSGSGKSTLVNLLMRFWDPRQGQVLFDGHDLREVKLASLRSQIGLVFQDTFVFDTTLRENIAIGRPGATQAEIVQAAKAARLDSYIALLPDGYDTLLGERGVKMSGGQRQRLAIARALLRNPRILILDEATSALDSRTESEILDTLREVSRGRTTISITHRLSLAATANHIMVLDEGRVVEQGSHSELVKAGGLYQQLYEEQTSHMAEVLLKGYN